MERRRYERHEVHLPVRLADGGEGVTRDMSVSGAYIEAPVFDVPVGKPFDFSVTFGETGSGSWELRCRGLVIRIENRGDRVGIAASIERYLEINSAMSGLEQNH